ncbi:MAG TPA: RNase adapter RapZ [Gammaproteobacteria bacterium]|nr:RNase adapter RapZ [Gammaproteobacteria bacterium]
MRLIIVSGLSGSGKSVALHVLEDLGFYCIDNIPVALLHSFVDEILPRRDAAFEKVGLGLDARNRPSDIADIPALIAKLRGDGVECDIIFLKADDQTLLSRFSETRRKHPLTDRDTSLAEAIAKERELLGPVINSAELVIDTTGMTVYELREQIRERVGLRAPGTLSILIESFGYKHGLPASADFVFDVRCLPNPYWEPTLRPLNGKDYPVRRFLDEQPVVQEMVDAIVKFLEEWIPRYQDFQRSYLTVAIGCTGGMHRSVYVAEAVARRLSATYGPIRTQHHEIP